MVLVHFRRLNNHNAALHLALNHIDFRIASALERM
jgi:hypothetical protein